MSTLDDIQADLAALAETIDFSPTEIPTDLAEMPAVEAVRKRLQALVENIGGYAVLAEAIPRYNAKMWQNKIEANGRFKLMVTDFDLLADFFKDTVLIALVGHKFGLTHVDLNAIPPSDYSLADLSWALRRYQAQAQLLTCDLRERQLDGESTSEETAKLARVTKEAIILLRQMDIALKAIAAPGSGSPDIAGMK